MAKTFLQAEWRKLAMANYAIDPSLLNSYLPNGTELDLFKGTCYVSLVGFMFVDTRIKGIRIPFHCNFEEVNLRFYVRYNDQGEWKRGVVFIKEIVPRYALSLVANVIYNENYVTLPMRHEWNQKTDCLEVTYQWKTKIWNTISVVTGTVAREISAGSEAEFITEHYWGYTKTRNGKTSEYGVEHPKWKVYDTQRYSIDVDFGMLYGDRFSFLKHETPRSVFLAEGSEIVVRGGRVF